MRKPLPGYFITVEGIDGCGKSTQLQLLEEHLIQRGYEVVVTKAPGGTVTSDALRTFFLENHRRLSPRSEVAILLAALNETWHEVIEPALDASKIVLSDRWYGSTMAYQGGGKGYDRGMISSLIAAVLGDAYAPNLSLYFRAEFETAQDRMADRDPNKLSSLDKAGEFFFNKVIRTYDHYYPTPAISMNGQQPNHYRIDGERPLEEVFESARALVDRRIHAWEGTQQLARIQLPLGLKEPVTA
jgi:dTMP kinase